MCASSIVTDICRCSDMSQPNTSFLEWTQVVCLFYPESQFSISLIWKAWFKCCHPFLWEVSYKPQVFTFLRIRVCGFICLWWLARLTGAFLFRVLNEAWSSGGPVDSEVCLRHSYCTQIKNKSLRQIESIHLHSVKCCVTCELNVFIIVSITNLEIKQVNIACGHAWS